MRIGFIMIVAATLLSGCMSSRDTLGDAGGSISDIGSSFRDGFSRNTDTYGTQRRVDVYGGSTAPSLPSIGTPGLGK